MMMMMMTMSAFHQTNTLILDLYSANPVKQQSASGHIILIHSQPVFVFTPECCVHSGKAANFNFIVFGLTRVRLRLEPTIYRTPGEHASHYTTDAVPSIMK